MLKFIRGIINHIIKGATIGTIFAGARFIILANPTGGLIVGLINCFLWVVKFVPGLSNNPAAQEPTAKLVFGVFLTIVPIKNQVSDLAIKG